MFFRRTSTSSLLAVWLFAGVLFVLKAIWLLTNSVRNLATTTWIIDDTFIEMGVARNIARGLGFSYDGIHPTTGSPFLWTYFTSLNHMLFPEDLAIKMTLIESTFFSALATVVVFLIALRLSRPAVAWTAFLLASFTGNAFFNAMNGMDTALFTLAALLTVSTFLGVGRPKRWSDMAWGAVVGLCGGFTVMTRGDGIFLLGTVGLFQILRVYRTTGAARKSQWSILKGMILTAGLCFLLFMGWQLLSTGSPFPANQVGRRQLALALHNFSYADFSLPLYLKIVIWNVFQLEHLVHIATGSTILVLVALTLSLFKKETKEFAQVTLLFTGVFFLMLVAYQWYFPDFHGLRYMNPPAHLFFVLIAILLWELPVNRWKTSAISLLTLSIIVLSIYAHRELAGKMPWGKEMSYIARPTEENLQAYWGTIDWMRDNIPNDTIIGVRDHGRTAMFADKPIQDLAGNIDPSIPDRVNDGTLARYLRERNVQYVFVASPQQRGDKLYQVMFSTMKLEPVHEAPLNREKTLYRIIWE